MTVLGLVAWLALQGCALPCASGIIANFEIESRLQPRAVSRSGAGMAQWSGRRRSRLLATLGAGWRDGYAQLRFMVMELGELGLRDRLFAERDPADAARLFMLRFECPRHRHTETRARRAREIYREVLTYGR